MYVDKIKLYNFRSYSELSVDFCENWNILIGENGVGKTNILEAIYYAFTSRSPRTVSLKDLIHLDAENKEFSVNLDCIKNEISLKVNQKYLYKNQKSYKVINLNSKKIPVIELLGKLPFVYFVPEDLNIIKGDSKLRRKLLDFILFQIDPSYKFLLTKYNKILKERNALLRSIRDQKINDDFLNEWDTMLVEAGIELYLKRFDLVEILNQKLINFFQLEDNYFKEHHLELSYKSIFDKSIDKDKKNLKKIYLEKLNKNRDREIRYGFSLIGIHRDNLNLKLNHKNIKKFGSQGQQRLFVLILKVLIAEIIYDFTQEKPILIFDDVFSELDNNKIKSLINILGHKYQVFVSSVSIDSFADNFVKINKKIFEVGEL